MEDQISNIPIDPDKFISFSNPSRINLQPHFDVFFGSTENLSPQKLLIQSISRGFFDTYDMAIMVFRNGFVYLKKEEWDKQHQTIKKENRSSPLLKSMVSQFYKKGYFADIRKDGAAFKIASFAFFPYDPDRISECIERSSNFIDAFPVNQIFLTHKPCMLCELYHDKEKEENLLKLILENLAFSETNFPKLNKPDAPMFEVTIIGSTIGVEFFLNEQMERRHELFKKKLADEGINFEKRHHYDEKEYIKINKDYGFPRDGKLFKKLCNGLFLGFRMVKDSKGEFVISPYAKSLKTSYLLAKKMKPEEYDNEKDSSKKFIESYEMDEIISKISKLEDEDGEQPKRKISEDKDAVINILKRLNNTSSSIYFALLFYNMNILNLANSYFKISDENKNQIGPFFPFAEDTKAIVVLSADIRNFTPFSSLFLRAPKDIDWIHKGLNKYLQKATHIVLQNGGMIDKYIGDELLAIWGATSEAEHGISENIIQAIETAIEIVKIFEVVKKEYFDPMLNTRSEALDIDVGIGIECGDAKLGFCGGKDTRSYSAIGDTVNIACRLQSHAAKIIETKGRAKEDNMSSDVEKSEKIEREKYSNVLVGKSAYRKISLKPQHIKFKSTPRKLFVKGKDSEIEFYELDIKASLFQE